LAFLDIGPLSKGHALIIPKCMFGFYELSIVSLIIHLLDHAEKMHELPDEYLHDVLPIAKKIALAQGSANYNVLQNNGRLAHQVSWA
jgi:diadenosine tetraphosphate (Ap4A) HIT family hydrolase